MASTLPVLCLYEIFHCVLEKRSLYSCAQVSRHWCQNAIPVMWREPLPVESAGPFIETLLRCFPETKSEKPLMFQYSYFIKQISVTLFYKAIVQWARMNWTSDQEKSPLIISKTLHFLLRNLIIQPNAFIDLDIEFDEEIQEIIDKEKSDFQTSEWNLFTLPGAEISLGHLKSLTIFGKQNLEILLMAGKICPRIESLKIFGDPQHLFPILPKLENFINLKDLHIDNMGFYTLWAEDYLKDLAKQLPNTLEGIYIYDDLNFSPDALAQFYEGLKHRSLLSCSLPNSECISDKHLDVFAEYGKGKLTILDIGEARYVSRKKADELLDMGIIVYVRTYWDEEEWDEQFNFLTYQLRYPF
ncbi:hypothetical protein G9A89_002502 [Geosiphon pyriformis]|nr:hypothetical protein G9A89_002502 [Geosiphon pyriformis]